MSWIDHTALQCLRALPAPFQHRILRDSEFQRKVGINGVAAPFNDAGRIRIGDLLDAVKKVYDEKRPHTVKNLDGDDVLLDLHDRRAVILRVGDEARDKTSTPFEFGLLSPEAQIRLEAFGVITRQFSVTGPKSSDWVPILETRRPSNHEVSQIHDAIRQSVPNWWTTTQDKIASGQLAPIDLIPSRADYFVALCGPYPNGIGVNEYILGPLADHRKTLASENLLDGMSLLLPGSLRADASIVPALAKFDNNKVLDAANRLRNMPDPFSLLGLIEIAIARRTTMPEFDAIASDLIEKLCGATLSRHDGVDVYDFFPALVDLSRRHLRRIDGMMTQPPYWHWLCAFIHAGVLTRQMDGLKFDPNEMTQWVAVTRENSDGLADILALRTEPTWRFDHLTRDRIQAEIIGRLKGLAQKEGAEERELPHSDLINKRIDEFNMRGISPFRPGPLEGNLRPRDHKATRALPADVVNELLVKLNDGLSKFPWAGIDNVSATAFLPEELRIALTKKLLTNELIDGKFVERANVLTIAALVAAVHQDRDMAEAIAERLFREFEGEDDTQTAFLTLIVASTAIGEDEWIGWLREKLYRLSFIAQKGLPIKVLNTLLDELKKLLPISQWKFGQIEALCKVF